MRFARRVSWTEKVLEGREPFNALYNCGENESLESRGSVR